MTAPDARRIARETLDRFGDVPLGTVINDHVVARVNLAAALRALLASTTPEPAAASEEAFAAFGRALLPLWWDDGNPGDIDGGDAQDAAEAAGLWHRVERHADGVECEWCGGEGPCGELTETGLTALSARGGAK